MEDQFETIVAPATPLGRSALGIVRIDGPSSYAIVRDLSGGVELAERRATRIRLHDGETEIDEVVAVRYAAPRSFTGNDLVELTTHGSPAVVVCVIDAIAARGARVAEPGEFTERAVLNGKLDLTQAEAIGDLVASRTSVQARLSLRLLHGELSRVALGARSDLLELIAKLEAALDFAEEGYEFVSRDEAARRISEIRERVEALASSYARGRATTEGLIAVLLGRPNAGKSTLLNFLCGSDRAIVASEPGTTRDLLRETVEIGGLPVTIVDTAGLRADAGAVENEGIRRARAAASDADLVVYLVDATSGMTDEDREEIGALVAPRVVFTKIDLAAAPPGTMGLSVPAGKGVAEFLDSLDQHVRERYVVPEGSPAIVNARQRRALDECGEGLAAAGQALERGATEEIVLVDVYRAANALGVLVGAITNDEMLGEIFSKFCIGK